MLYNGKKQPTLESIRNKYLDFQSKNRSITPTKRFISHQENASFNALSRSLQKRMMNDRNQKTILSARTSRTGRICKNKHNKLNTFVQPFKSTQFSLARTMNLNPKLNKQNKEKQLNNYSRYFSSKTISPQIKSTLSKAMQPKVNLISQSGQLFQRQAIPLKPANATKKVDKQSLQCIENIETIQKRIKHILNT